MFTIKVLLTVSLALGSAGVLMLVRGRSWEEVFLKRALIIATLVKVSGCASVYAIWPSLIQYSDASHFYLPQTMELLSGKVPNRDFDSSYSVLFLPLLALPVKLWPSAGAVALTMLLAETAMLVLYLKRTALRPGARALRVAFLYTLSPFSVYWVALSGHNGVLIAFWVMLALVLAETGRALYAGVAAAMGLLATKLLAVLAWPGIVAFEKRDWARRAMPMAISVGVGAGLLVFDLDFISPIQAELGRSTTGNLWGLMSRILPGGTSVTASPWLSIASFSVGFLLMSWVFLSRYTDEDRFDRTAAFVAAVNLLFLLVSSKAFSFYLVMCLIFVIHTVLACRHRFRLSLVSITYLGAVSCFEEIHDLSNYPLLTLEGLRLLCYAYLMFVCLQVATRRDSLTADAE